MADAAQPVYRGLRKQLAKEREKVLRIERAIGLQKSLGLAKNILSVRLRNLVAHDILQTVPASDGSAYQEYVLTEKGRGLFPLLVALRQWGEAYFFEPDEAHVVLVDRKSGAPVQKLELRSQDGRRLAPEDTIVVLPQATTAKKRKRPAKTASGA